MKVNRWSFMVLFPSFGFRSVQSKAGENRKWNRLNLKKNGQNFTRLTHFEFSFPSDQIDQALSIEYELTPSSLFAFALIAVSIAAIGIAGLTHISIDVNT